MKKTKDLNRLLCKYLSNANCPYEELVYYYNGFKEDLSVCEAIGKNPNCSEELIRELEKIDPEFALKNPNCPSDILDKHIDNKRLWFFITQHKNTTTSTLRKIYNMYCELASYDKPYYSDDLSYLVSNINCPIEIFEKEFSNPNSTIRWKIASNPKCPKKVINLILKQSNDFDKKFLLSNPSIPFDRLMKIYKLYPDVEILENPNIPYEMFKEIYEKNQNSFDCLYHAIRNPKYSITIYDDIANRKKTNVNLNRIVSSPDCTQELLIKFSDTNDMEVIESILHNNKCPYILLEKYADSDNVGILASILIHPNCTIHLFDYIVEKNISYSLSLVHILNAKILDDKCPKKYIQYVANNQFLKSYLNEQAIKKIEKVTALSTSFSYFFDKYFEQKEYPSNHLDLNYLSKGINYKKGNDSDIKTDFSIDINGGPSALITVKCDNEKFVGDKLKEFGKDVIAYGEYPQRRATGVESWVLDNLYDNKLLNKTGKQYRIVNILGFVSYYKEYEIDGCKFVKGKNKWYIVEPIYWKYDFEEKQFVCEKNLFGLDPILKDKSKMIHKFFANDIVVPEILFSKEERQEAIESRKNQQINEKPDDKIVDRKLKELKTQNKNYEEEKDNLELEIFLLLEKLDERVKKLNDLQDNKKSAANIPRIHIDENVFLENVGDHYEFKPKYIPFLKYIDLSGLLIIDNIKVSGIDFRETNISINPQRVYKKDLSFSKFNDSNIVFKSLAGVNLTGTDISDDKNCYGFETAIVDSETVLPKRVK